MIRDTSAQDRQLTPQKNRRKQFAWIGAGVAGLAFVLACVPTVIRLVSADSSASSARLRIAEVKRGTLVRDVSVQGRVVAAVAPTLYARNAGTVRIELGIAPPLLPGQSASLLLDDRVLPAEPAAAPAHATQT